MAIFFVGFVLSPAAYSAPTPENLYHKANACWSQLTKDAKKKKYRDNWLRCIERYQAAYRRDTAGPWAAASLYMSGDLYLKLHRYSGRTSDQQKAIDLYERIVDRHPGSRYKQKAEAALKSLGLRVSKRKSPRSQRSAKTARAMYDKADSCYRSLLESPKKQKYRDQWLRCIDGFRAVHREDPDGPWAAAGLYRAGHLYQGLYRRSYRKADHRQAVDIFKRIIAHYPKSSYRGKAESALGMTGAKGSSPRTAKPSFPPKQTGKKAAKTVAGDPRGATVSKVVPGPAPTAPTHYGPAVVTGLRHWSNPSYTRIVIDVDRKAAYTHRLLKRDPSISKPQRLYIDIDRSRLGDDIEKMVPIDDELLLDVRAGQYKPDTVRVVVDIKSFERRQVFSLYNPFRIVVDMRGKDVPVKPAAKPKHRVQIPPKGSKKLAPSALAKQLALGVKRIVIDPGHGGRDRGAPGYLKGTYEKDITLMVAKRLARKIREKLGCEVFLTRKTDRYVTLEERTAIANTKNADLFISIHTNAAKDRRAHGIMTFFLNLATDDESIMVAARENATSTNNISDLETILSQLMQNAKINESSRLASHVQKSTFSHLKTQYSRIKSKGVKQAPFYVLLGAQMPAILVETSFISNARECKRLVNSHYQEQMSEGILRGIQGYIQETNPTARLEARPDAPSKPG